MHLLYPYCFPMSHPERKVEEDHGRLAKLAAAQQLEIPLDQKHSPSGAGIWWIGVETILMA